MATRPSLFGLRLRDKQRTVRVKAKPGQSHIYVLEDSRGNSSSRREHASVRAAVKDAAKTWRHRLN